MLARPANLSTKQASHYYEKDDYYSQEKGSWFSCYWYGKGAEELGLEGAIDSRDFQQLLEGYSLEGNRLHAKPIDSENHRAATDYVFNAPKSVSASALLKKDYRLIEAHDRAVQSALKPLEERYTQARAWNPETRQQDKVFTGNLAIAIYRHETNRNQDPHLHSHCVSINATQDGWRWKAVSNELAVQNQKLLGQIYQNDLAYQVRQLGYEIEPREHGQFELKDYSQKTLEAFSTRRREIEDHLTQTGEVESVRNFQRAAIQTRSRKTVLNQEGKHDRWDAVISQQQLELLPIPEAREIKMIEAEVLVQRGVEQLAEQESAFRREQLEQTILENSLGQCLFKEIEAAINHSPKLVQYGDRLITRDRLERLTALEELLGLDYAKNQARETEQTGGVIEADTSRGVARDIGNSVAQRLATTLREGSRTRRNSEQIDHCLEWIDESNAEPGIDVEAVARGVEAIRDREALGRAGEEIAATLESVSYNLTEFERVGQQLNRLIEGYRDQLADRETERPLPGSQEWGRAQFVLGYCEAILRENNLIWVDNDLYWAERNPVSGEVLVGRKENSQTIAQGRLGVVGWDISITSVELNDWMEFVKSKQRQRELEQQREGQEEIDSTERPRGFEIGD